MPSPTLELSRYLNCASPLGSGSRPVGSTCTSTSADASAAISSWNRCRRAISNATRPTCHGRVGTASGLSTRPTCSTYTDVAPSATARPTGIESTSPPSKKCSSPTATGGSSPGTAHDAITAGTSGPLLNQRAHAPSIEAATH
jgi:hypothetical protein